MNYLQFTEEIRRHVLSVFLSHPDSGHVYHNLEHTESVVKHATEIAEHYLLNSEDLFIITAAAWFHDIGYLTGEQSGHEMRGAEMIKTFLLEHQITDEHLTDSIVNCILATRFPQNPKNLKEEIVCDADLYHLGTPGFSDRNKLMHKEAERIQGREIGKKEWRRGTIRLMESHHYFTDYCRSLLEQTKKQNLDKLLSKEHKTKAHEPPLNKNIPSVHPEEIQIGRNLPGEGPITTEKKTEKSLHKENRNYSLNDLVKAHIASEENEEKDVSQDAQAKKNDTEPGGKPKKKKRPERGIDTVFKITSNNNQRLSSQADSKAHIMIQVNSIIISVLISMLFRKIEEYRYLAVPAVMLLIVNLITIIFSVLATRPQIPGGTFSRQDIDDKKVNLLFFGNFYKMTLEDYAAGMLALMDEYDFLYMSLIRDVYFQGKVLGRKYHLLRISYNVFMYGLVLAVFGFVVAFTFFSGK